MEVYVEMCDGSSRGARRGGRCGQEGPEGCVERVKERAHL